MKLRSALIALSLLVVFSIGLPMTAAAAVAGATSRKTPITPNGSWPIYHGNDAHTGADLTPGQASGAAAGWTSASLDEQVYASPLVYGGMVFTATLNNTVYAINQTDGTAVWTTHLRAPTSSGWSCGNVSPQGILGTPVIDPATSRIYAVTLGSDHVYRLEGLRLSDGLEQVTTIITTSGFDWTIQQERGALAVANGYVYVPFGGRAGDCGAYHGYVFAVPTSGTGTVHVYQTPGAGAGFWNAGGVVIDDATGNAFETSGNGVASGCNSNGDGSPTFENDAIVRFSPTLSHLDSFVPIDWQANYCNNDQDLGSAPPVLIKTATKLLTFQSSKWGTSFVNDANNLGGVGGQLYPAPGTDTSDTCFGKRADATFGSFAYAAPYVYVECEGNGLVALKFDPAAPSVSLCDAVCGPPTWTTFGGITFGPPIVARGAVWVIDIGGSGLYGFRATDGRQIFQSGGFSTNHFITPAEAGAQIFVPAGNQILQFVMHFGVNQVSGVPTPPARPAPPTQTGAPAPPSRQPVHPAPPQPPPPR